MVKKIVRLASRRDIIRAVERIKRIKKVGGKNG